MHNNENGKSNDENGEDNYYGDGTDDESGEDIELDVFESHNLQSDYGIPAPPAQNNRNRQNIPDMDVQRQRNFANMITTGITELSQIKKDIENTIKVQLAENKDSNTNRQLKNLEKMVLSIKTDKVEDYHGQLKYAQEQLQEIENFKLNETNPETWAVVFHAFRNNGRPKLVYCEGMRALADQPKTVDDILVCREAYGDGRTYYARSNKSKKMYPIKCQHLDDFKKKDDRIYFEEEDNNLQNQPVSQNQPTTPPPPQGITYEQMQQMMADQKREITEEIDRKQERNRLQEMERTNKDLAEQLRDLKKNPPTAQGQKSDSENFISALSGVYQTKIKADADINKPQGEKPMGIGEIVDIIHKLNPNLGAQQPQYTPPPPKSILEQLTEMSTVQSTIRNIAGVRDPNTPVEKEEPSMAEKADTWMNIIDRGLEKTIEKLPMIKEQFSDDSDDTQQNQNAPQPPNPNQQQHQAQEAQPQMTEYQRKITALLAKMEELSADEQTKLINKARDYASKVNKLSKQIMERADPLKYIKTIKKFVRGGYLPAYKWEHEQIQKWLPLDFKGAMGEFLIMLEHFHTALYLRPSKMNENYQGMLLMSAESVRSQEGLEYLGVIFNAISPQQAAQPPTQPPQTTDIKIRKIKHGKKIVKTETVEEPDDEEIVEEDETMPEQQPPLATEETAPAPEPTQPSKSKPEPKTASIDIDDMMTIDEDEL